MEHIRKYIAHKSDLNTMPVYGRWNQQLLQMDDENKNADIDEMEEPITTLEEAARDVHNLLHEFPENAAIPNQSQNEIRTIIEGLHQSHRMWVARRMKNILIQYHHRMSTAKFDIGAIKGHEYTFKLREGT